ncbi:Saposin B-type domain-containing protein [Entamoeba marina]
MFAIGFCFLLFVANATQNNINKRELSRFKSLVSKRIDNELSKDPLAIIHTRHLQKLYTQQGLLKKSLLQNNKRGKSKDKNISELQLKLKEIDEKIKAEKQRLEDRSRKIASTVRKGIEKYRNMYVEETIHRSKGIPKATEIRRTKEKYQSRLQDIQMQLIRHSTTRHKQPNHKAVKAQLKQKKLQTKLKMQQSLKNISKDQHLKQETKTAKLKEEFIKSELFDMQTKTRRKYLGVVARLRNQLLDIKQSIIMAQKRLSEFKSLKKRLKLFKENAELIKKDIKQAEMDIIQDLRQLITNSMKRINKVGEEMIQFSGKAAVSRNIGMWKYVKSRVSEITSNHSLWNEFVNSNFFNQIDSKHYLNSSMSKSPLVVNPNKLSEENDKDKYLSTPHEETVMKMNIIKTLRQLDTTKSFSTSLDIERKAISAEQHFKKVVMGEFKQIQTVLQNNKQRRSALKKIAKKGGRVLGELDIVDSDVRMLELGIDNIQRYVKEALIRSHTAWAVVVGKGMIQRKMVLLALSKHCGEIKNNQKFEAELYWEAIDQIGKNLDGIKHINDELLMFGLKEADASEKTYSEAKRLDDKLQYELLKSYLDWKKVVSRSLERLKRIDYINNDLVKCGNGDSCVKCVKMSKMVRKDILNGKGNDLVLEDLKGICGKFENGGMKNCEKMALKIMRLSTKNNLDFLMKNTCDVCRNIGVCGNV